jgi:hypothetical protein
MRPAMPDARALAALGTVLCVYRGRAGGELAGWARAAHAAYVSALDSEGLRECIAFFDADDRACWRLYLLPDTDFLAWERLAYALPARCAGHDVSAGIAERLWRRWFGEGAQTAWQAGVLRLHALPGGPGHAALSILAASLAPLSAFGGDVARRILRSEGLDAGSAIDDCCCRQTEPRGTMATARDAPAQDAAAFPLIRFHVRPQA